MVSLAGDQGSARLVLLDVPAAVDGTTGRGALFSLSLVVELNLVKLSLTSSIGMSSPLPEPPEVKPLTTTSVMILDLHELELGAAGLADDEKGARGCAHQRRTS